MEINKNDLMIMLLELTQENDVEVFDRLMNSTVNLPEGNSNHVIRKYADKLVSQLEVTDSFLASKSELYYVVSYMVDGKPYENEHDSKSEAFKSYLHWENEALSNKHIRNTRIFKVTDGLKEEIY